MCAARVVPLPSRWSGAAPAVRSRQAARTWRWDGRRSTLAGACHGCARDLDSAVRGLSLLRASERSNSTLITTGIGKRKSFTSRSRATHQARARRVAWRECPGRAAVAPAANQGNSGRDAPARAPKFLRPRDQLTSWTTGGPQPAARMRPRAPMPSPDGDVIARWNIFGRGVG